MPTAARHKLTLLVIAILAVAGGYGLLRWHTHIRVAGAIEKVAGALPGVRAVDVGRIQTGFFGERIELTGLAVELESDKPAIRIDSAVVHSVDRSRPVPGWMHLELRGARLRSPDHLPEAASFLPSGIVPEQVVLDVEMVYRYRSESRELDLERVSVAVDQLGDLEIAGRFDNLELERLFQVPFRPAEAFGSLTGVRIRAATVTYRDRALVRQTIRKRARQRGMAPERYARILVERLRVRTESERQGTVARTLHPLRQFFTDPGRIRIVVEPRQPVTLGWLLWVRSPERLVELLGLRIETAA